MVRVSHSVTPLSQWRIVCKPLRILAVSKFLFESKELIAPFVKTCVWFGWVVLVCFYFLSRLLCYGCITGRAALSLSFRKSIGSMDGRFAIFLITFWSINFICHRIGIRTITRMSDFCVFFYVHLRNGCQRIPVSWLRWELCPSDWRKLVSVQYKRIIHKYYTTAVNEIVRQQQNLFSLTISPSSWSFLKSLLLVILALQVGHWTPHRWIIFLTQVS